MLKQKREEKLVGPYIKPYTPPEQEKKHAYNRIIDSIIRNNNSLHKTTTHQELITQTIKALRECKQEYDQALFQQTIQVLISTGRIHKKEDDTYY